MQIHIFIAHMTMGGAERVCVNLCNEFVQRGHEVHLVVLDLKNDVNSHLLNEKVQLHVLGVNRLRYALIPMFKYLKKYKPNFMLIFGLEMAVIINKLKQLHLTKVKQIVRVLNNVNISLSKEEKVSPVVENYLKSAQSQLADMSRVVAQCKAMGDMIVEKGLVGREKLSVIYNPVSTDLIQKVERLVEGSDKDAEQSAKLSESGVQHNTKEKQYRLTFIGRIDPQKQPEQLIEVFNKIHSQLPEATLRIVGDGILMDNVKARVAELELDKYVLFDGVRKDMENVYSNTDVVILTSSYEGMPNALIEAIGCGIPVVSYDCPIGPGEIIEDGVNGFLTPLDDIGTIADKVVIALKQDWDRDIIKATCKKFDVKNIADEYEKIFANVMEK